MKIKIAENIRLFRKQHSFTQEQLAEALGVTAGAVHKWEAGQSVPEVKLLMELADLFEISVDTLLGYDRQIENIENRIERIKNYVLEKDFDEAIVEVEKALKKYPNNFDVVYVAAKVYMCKASEDKDEKSSLKSNELFHNAITLLYQNKDSSINEVTILNYVGLNYLNAGHTEKAIEILKQNNICNMNSARIGFAYTMLKQPDEARSYLGYSYMSIINNVLHTIGGIALMYAQKKDKLCIEAGLWLVDFFDSIKKDENSIIFSDKIKAIILAEIAVMKATFGDYNKAEKYITDAYNLATEFDNAPIYTTNGVKFLTDEDEIRLSVDGLGETAVDGIEGFVFENAEPSEALDFVRDIFERLKNEKES